MKERLLFLLRLTGTSLAAVLIVAGASGVTTPPLPDASLRLSQHSDFTCDDRSVAMTSR